MGKKKVRTKAQRSAAAKKSWALRRLKGAKAPHRTPLPVVSAFVGNGASPPSSRVVREGDSFTLIISYDGALTRYRLTPEMAKGLVRDLVAVI